MKKFGTRIALLWASAAVVLGFQNCAGYQSVQTVATDVSTLASASNSSLSAATASTSEAVTTCAGKYLVIDNWNSGSQSGLTGWVFDILAVAADGSFSGTLQDYLGDNHVATPIYPVTGICDNGTISFQPDGGLTFSGSFTPGGNWDGRDEIGGAIHSWTASPTKL